MSEDRRPTGGRDGDSPSPLPHPAPAGEPTGASAATGSRRAGSRTAIVVGLLLGLLVLGGVTAVLTGAVGGLPGASGATPTPEVIVLPSPTPTIAPVARAPLSPFADSLPDGVLDFALTELADHRPLLLAGALEGYRLQYSDGGTRTLTVLAGQWGTATEAEAAFTAAVAAAGSPATDGDPPTGVVLVGGAVVGDWAVTTPAEGQGTVTWWNGTAVLQLTGPADVVRDAYAAYPY